MKHKKEVFGGLLALVSAVSPIEVMQATGTQTPIGVDGTYAVNDRIKVSGIVIDENGEPVIGANILIEGTNIGTITDIDGKFSLTADEGASMLVTFVGMKQVQLKVNKRMVNFEIVLEHDNMVLDDVVVTGYQTLSKERATGSYAVLTDKSTKGKLETNILSRIEGLVAGINRTDNGEEDIVIRGITTVNGDRKPLYVVDGMPYEGEMSAINPSDVQNITVLKDAAASSIYGARAANGVIVITTKRGAEGKTKVSYNGSVKISPKPDMDYLNLMSSSELVDMQMEFFDYYHANYEDLNPRASINPVVDLLYQHERGMLNDQQLNEALVPYRTLSNRQQIEDEFMRTAITHQHNFSLSGGTDRNRFMASLNYTGNYGNQRYQSNSRIGFNLKDDLKLTRWLSASVGVSGNIYKDNGDNGVDGFESLYSIYPSYYMLRDENGNSLDWIAGKSEYELDRLVSIGLLEERHNPIENRSKERYSNTKNYYRIFAGLDFKIMDGLTFDIKYQTESTYYKNRQVKDADSFSVCSMVNNAAQYDAETKQITYNVPKGGQLYETRGDMYSYTLRAQLNFNRTFKDKHAVTALGGAERRLVRSTATTGCYFGYDENSLSYSPFNPLILTPIYGTEAVSGYYTWYYDDNNYLSHKEDRYVSFFANASYTFDEKYSVTGSMRIDQSNLFGTDPKYQYRPLWSVGANWMMAKESFLKDVSWLNRLNLRVTYGIGGNVPKDTGPYLSLTDNGYNQWVGSGSFYISSPPNSQLRWEKTETTNIGIDFDIFKSRLSGSIDFYNKYTSDLLGYRNSDPTLGWKSLMLNYGTMYNRGVELALQSVNIKHKDFTWGTNLVFSYNKNMLVDMEGTTESVFNYVAYDVAAKGYPLNSLFSYRYAGLDPEKGSVLVYDKEGNKVSNVNSIDDLVYSGTRIPKYTASLKNFFTYKDFDLSFMFIYYGGHVTRGITQDYIKSLPGRNMNRINLNHWRQPGDENIPGVGPALNRTIYYQNEMTWYSADIHVKRADYIKLRDVSIGYNIPRKWLRKYMIESATVTCQISNLWWWAANGEFDLEAYGRGSYGRGLLTLPNPATYTLGLSVNF